MDGRVRDVVVYLNLLEIIPTALTWPSCRRISKDSLLERMAIASMYQVKRIPLLLLWRNLPHQGSIYFAYRSCHVTVISRLVWYSTFSLWNIGSDSDRTGEIRPAIWLHAGECKKRSSAKRDKKAPRPLQIRCQPRAHQKNLIPSPLQ